MEDMDKLVYLIMESRYLEKTMGEKDLLKGMKIYILLIGFLQILIRKKYQYFKKL